MRLFVFNCLLLASVGVALPNGHQKREAIFGRSQINIQPEPVLREENGYKLFRQPGYDDVLIKNVPKRPVVEEFVYSPAVEKVNINAFGTVVGTKLNDDTLVAVKEVDNLLSTDKPYGGPNNVMKETMVPMFPSINTANNVVEEKIKTATAIETRPVVTEVIENEPVFTEVIENRPVISEIIRPLEVELKVPFEPTYYTYKQIQNNKPVMTYTIKNNPRVGEVETLKMKTEQPMYIKKRVDEAIVLGADQNRFAPVQKIFQYQNPPVVDFSYPRVDTNSYIQNSFRKQVVPVQKVFQYQSPQIFDSLNPRVEANTYVQNSLRDVLTEGFGTVPDFGFPPQTLRLLKYSPVRNNLRPTKTQAINPRPVPLHSHNSPHFEEDIIASKNKVDPQTKEVQVFNNLGEKVNLSQTLGPIPPQYITHESKKGGNSEESNGNMKQMKDVPIVGSKENVSNANIPVDIYNLQSDPNTGKVVKENRGLRTNTYRFEAAPAVNSQATKKDIAEVENVVYTNKVTANPQSVTPPIEVASTNATIQPLRENIQTSIIHKPTGVKDNKNYSYQKTNADGSSLNINGNKHGVTVIVKENNNRGDIPDQ